MPELEHQPGAEERGEKKESGPEAAEGREQPVFDEAAKEDEVRGQEVRVQREVNLEVTGVKAQIEKAFAQVRRRQEQFAGQVSGNPEMSANLGRFLEFMNKLKQEGGAE